MGEDHKSEMVTSLRKRLANIKNELGVWYMNQAQACLQADGGCSKKFELQWNINL